MRRRIFAIITLASLILAAVTITFEGYRGATQLRVTRYEVETKLTESIRIVHLTDLHSCVYGENNEKLVQLVAEQEPDLILMTGDMLSRSDDGPGVVCALIPKLLEIAPVYYGYGNHEFQWENRTGESLEPALEAAGAVVLNTTCLDVTVNEQALRIGGYHGYYRQPGMYDISPEQHQAELDFAADFENTDRYKILLSHIPTAWLDWGYINTCPVDLVLSGHYHGGQIVLPPVGGLAAPYVGLFPEYTRGLYVGEKAICVLSAGVGTEDWLPRINNLPEVVVVELVPGK